MKQRIFGFGSAAVDFRIQTADYGSDHKDKLLAQEIQLFGGGSVANFLTQVARLGGDAFWMGKLGNDWIGREIIRNMKVEGIDCSTAIINADSCSPFNIAVYAGEQKRRVGGFLLPNSLATLTNEELKRLAERVSEGDMLMLEIGEIPFSQCLAFLDFLEGKRVQVIMDVDLDPVKQCRESAAASVELFGRADYLIPNLVAMKTLYPAQSAEGLTLAIAKEYGRPTVITAGDQGAFYCIDGLNVQHILPVNVDVVDTIGAGDAFHGGFVYALSEGMSFEKAVELGVQCGSYKCKTRGARSGMPYRGDSRLIF